jgi:protein Mpv17
MKNRRESSQVLLILVVTLCLAVETVVAFQREFRTNHYFHESVHPRLQTNHFPSFVDSLKRRRNVVKNYYVESFHKYESSNMLKMIRKRTNIFTSNMDQPVHNPITLNTSSTLIPSIPRYFPLMCLIKPKMFYNLLFNKVENCNKDLCVNGSRQNNAYLYASMIPIMSITQFYSSALQSAPIATKSISSGIIFAISDWLAQRSEKQQQPQSPLHGNINDIQWSRIIASGIVGLFYYGPASHYWYEWLFHWIPGMSLYDTFKKVALGQIIFDPIFTCIYFASSLMQSRQLTFHRLWIKIRNDLPSVTIAGIGFWPLTEAIGMVSMSKDYLPIYISLCSLQWTTYLAKKSNDSQLAFAES